MSTFRPRNVFPGLWLAKHANGSAGRRAIRPSRHVSVSWGLVRAFDALPIRTDCALTDVRGLRHPALLDLKKPHVFVTDPAV